MSNCCKPNGKDLCFYPTNHWVVGGAQEQQHKKNQEQVIKNLISQLQVTPEPCSCLNLLSPLRPLLNAPSDNQNLTCLLSSSFQFFQHTQHTSQCWTCTPLPPSPHRAIPLPSTQGNYTSPPQQNTTQLIGPVSDNILLPAPSNLTCINYSSSNYTGLTNSTPAFCSTWVLWNCTNDCTNLGIFILCRTYSYSCLPSDSLGPCILVFLTLGLTILKEEEIEQIVDPQVEHSHRKTQAIVAPS